MKPHKIKKLLVITPQGQAGYLTKEARYVFNYTTQDPKAAISLTMPIRSESYAYGALLPIFEMNRPEGYLLEKIKLNFARLGLMDDMTLLWLTGQRQIGRLNFNLEIAAKTFNTIKKGEKLAVLLAPQSHEALFNYLLEHYALSSGISGIQPKVLVPNADLASDKTTVVTQDYIVKIGSAEYPGLIQNEFLCMSVAKTAGLSVPHFWLSEDSQRFIMQRFDVIKKRRAGFEDMCVLMKKSAAEKYNGSYEQIIKAIELYCGEAATLEKQRFFAYFVLCVLLRNGDAHLKNFGLLYDYPGGKNPYLAPLYDLVTTTLYPILDKTMALNLNKKRVYPSRKEIMKFAELCGVLHPKPIIENLIEAMHSTLSHPDSRLDKTFIRDIEKQWHKGIDELK